MTELFNKYRKYLSKAEEELNEFIETEHKKSLEDCEKEKEKLEHLQQLMTSFDTFKSQSEEME